MLIKKLLPLLLLSFPVFAAHPILWLDSTELTFIRSKVTSNTADWQALKAQCDALTAGSLGSINPQRALDERYSQTAASIHLNALSPHVSAGYQGAGASYNVYGYREAVMALGVCYQATIVGNPSLAATYATKALELVDVLGISAGIITGPAITVSSVTKGNPWTTFNATSHHLGAREEVIISGATGDWAAFNDRWTVDVASTSTFRISVNSSAFTGSFNGTVNIVRHVSDSTWSVGTAWNGSVLVNGNQTVSSTISLKGLTPSGTILAGDSFTVGTAVMTVAADTTANGSGIATVTIGNEVDGGSFGNFVNNKCNGCGSFSVTDGAAVSREIVILSSNFGTNSLGTTWFPTGTPITVSGVTGNTGANGTWTVTRLDANRLLLQGSGPGAVQTNIVWDTGVNSGYGARNFGPALAFLYDWLYAEMSSGQRAGMRDACKRWALDGTRQNTVGVVHPGSNYATGTTMTIALAALTVEPEDAWGTSAYAGFRSLYFDPVRSYAASTWSPPGISDYFSNYVSDYYYPDGPAYGNGSAVNIMSMIWAMQTAKAYNPLTDPKPFNWFNGSAKYDVQMKRPGAPGYILRTISNQGGGGAYPNRDALRYYIAQVDMKLGFLTRLSDTYASTYKSWRDALDAELTTVNNASTGAYIAPYTVATPVYTFLNYDPSQSSTDYTLQPNYNYTASVGELVWRTDWTANAISGLFAAGQRVQSYTGDKDGKDRGSLILGRGKYYLLTLPDWEYMARQDIALKFYYAGVGAFFPQFQNILQVDNGGTRTKQQSLGFGVGFYGFDTNGCRGLTDTTIANNGGEVTSDYVFAEGIHLDSAYYSTTSTYCDPAPRVVTGWTRSVFSLLPNITVVYDRSTIQTASWDQQMAWHLGHTPVEVSAPAGMHRYDVNSTADSFYKGSVYTILPAGHLNTLYDISGHLSPVASVPTDVAYRLEVRPPAAVASQNWMTMFDLSSSSGAVATPEYINGTNVDVLHITNAGGETIVAFPKTDTPTLPMTYSIPNGSMTNYVAGMAASTAYHVTSTTSTATIAAATGSGDTTSSSAGVLTFSTSGTPPALGISSTSLSSGTVGVAYSQTLVGVGGTSPYTWAVSAGALPNGLSLNTSTGEISGTPTTAQTTTPTIRITDNVSATTTKGFSITIAAAPPPPTTGGAKGSEVNLKGKIIFH